MVRKAFLADDGVIFMLYTRGGGSLNHQAHGLVGPLPLLLLSPFNDHHIIAPIDATLFAPLLACALLVLPSYRRHRRNRRRRRHRVVDDVDDADDGDDGDGDHPVEHLTKYTQSKLQLLKSKLTKTTNNHPNTKQ